MRNYESDAYRKYQSSIEQRQKVVRTSGSPYSQQTAVQWKGQRAEMSASTKRKRTREKEIETAFHSIEAFEKQLTDGGTILVKLLLDIDQKEQKKRTLSKRQDKFASEKHKSQGCDQ